MKAFTFYHSDQFAQEIDILLEAPLDYDHVVLRKVIKQTGALQIPVISIPDLIVLKEAAHRKQDLSDVQMLKKILELSS